MTYRDTTIPNRARGDELPSAVEMCATIDLLRARVDGAADAADWLVVASVCRRIEGMAKARARVAAASESAPDAA